MSHIDSFKHEIVGKFAGIPIYHPLEDIDGDFKCDSSHLILGGGSGEWPALIIKNPSAAVAEFLEYELSAFGKEDSKKNKRDTHNYIFELFQKQFDFNYLYE